MYNLSSKLINYTLTIVILGSFSISVNAAGGDKSFGYSNRYGSITPAQVYSLAQNVEILLTYYVDKHKKGIATEVKALNLEPVSGKTPEDAFVKLHQLSDVLDRLARRTQLQPMKRITREKTKAIPAEVYLQAGNNLDALINIMNKLEPNKTWGDYYPVNSYTQAKVPSDVFALTDLTLRRLELILG